MKKYLLTIFLSVFLLTGFFTFKAIPDKFAEKTEEKNPGTEENFLDKLTLEQKIGQIFIIGFDGTFLTPELKNLVKNLHPGGILLLEKNIENQEQLKKLIDSLQRIALEDVGLPLFVAVDQEGGLISRLKWAEDTPQSKIKTSEQAYEIGKRRGEDLKQIGINLNLAPLLDFVVKGDFIFQRSFQNNQEKTGEFSKNLILGQKGGGVLSTIKHFPGYGNIFFNPEDKLAKMEKIPEFSQFVKAAQAEPEFIMLSNVVYKEIDEALPFSFLPQGIDFLKQQIRGNYLIVSDDLNQYSLLNNFSLEQIVSSPFLAGMDVLIFSGYRKNSAEGIKAFKEAVEKGKITIDRLDESVVKIINLKQKMLKNYNEPGI